MATQLDLKRIKTMNLVLNEPVMSSLLDAKTFNIAGFEGRTGGVSASATSGFVNAHKIEYENPFVLPIDIIRNVNNYRFVYKSELVQIYDAFNISEENKNADKQGGDSKVKGKLTNAAILSNVAVASSLFNPLYNVQVLGISDNVPLLIDNVGGGLKDYQNNNGDCSIKRLVRESLKYNSLLGNARYRYADFMYCKDLGKVANNHLITLRKFPYPVGDHIFNYSAPSYRNNGKHDVGDFDMVGDMGRLVTWFGTEDNKLEDILKFDYAATWKELNSKIQELDSKEESEKRGPLGQMLNSMSPSYNSYAARGFAGTQNMLRGLGGRFSGPSDNMEMLRNYDKNKVYEPKNTVQDTHIYEGKLKFNHEFTLTFCYKMRAYENINQKSAFLDLMGNILEVTYKRGQFWGGRAKIVGPQPNTQGWKKANAFIDNAWEKLGNYLSALADGSLNLNDILGKLADGAQELMSQAKEKANNALSDLGSDPNTITQNLASKVKKLNDKYGISDAIKGSLKNALGRPAMYAFDSLLEGGVSGLWHVTIGNPFNPIMVMGNLIMTKAVVQHLGPLGIDDFPTEIKVTVTLKHAKSRDLTSIAKMYTKGLGDIYLSNGRTSLANWYIVPNNMGDVKSYEKHLASSDKDKTKTDNDELYKNANESLAALPDSDYKNTDFEEGHLIKPHNQFLALTNQDRMYSARAVIDELA